MYAGCILQGGVPTYDGIRPLTERFIRVPPPPVALAARRLCWLPPWLIHTLLLLAPPLLAWKRATAWGSFLLNEVTRNNRVSQLESPYHVHVDVDYSMCVVHLQKAIHTSTTH
jgi:hypothetical protein